MLVYDVIIVGGGLAGLTAALELTRQGIGVLVIEKTPYPRHKVCGEYVSREVVPYLKNLGVDIETGVSIDQFILTTQKGTSFSFNLPLGGIGISRYALDDLLYKRCLQQGVQVCFDTVKELYFEDDKFRVSTVKGDTYCAEIVLGAYGKRSNIDKSLKRPFINQKSPWLAVKAHYHLPDFPLNQVALHNFDGGYCGLSKTETGAVNMCYLASYRNFSQYRNIDDFNQNVLSKNPFLANFLEDAQPLWKAPISIAQVSFAKKSTVTDHILFCGDTAGLIHPLCGNGMAMAIHSGKIASAGVVHYFKSEGFTRSKLEEQYQRHWRQEFGQRMQMGRMLQHLLLHDKLSQVLISGLSRFPKLTGKVIEKTHGKPIPV